MPTTHETESERSLYCGARPWRTLWQLYSPHWKTLLEASLYYIIKAAPTWVMPVISANIVNIVANPSAHSLREIGWNAAVLAVCLAENIPIHWLYIHRLSGVARAVELDLRAALVRRLQQLSITFCKETSPGALHSKVLRDVDAVDQAMRLTIDGGLAAAIAILSAIIVTACRAPQYLTLFLVAVPIIAAIRHFLSEAMKKRNSEFRSEVESMSTELSGMIEMIPITRAHADEEAEIERVTRKLDRVRTAGIQLDLQNAFFGAVSWVALNVFNFGGLILAAVLAYTRTIPLAAGDILLLSGYFGSISGALLMLLNMIPTITKGIDSVHSIGEILEHPDFEENQGKTQLNAYRGALEFKNISFIHPGSTHPALRDINLRLKEGETLAVIGPSGAGKSTLISLILGFHRPTCGQILLDGRDLHTIDLRSYRRFIGVVSQETYLFPGTVRENLVFGGRDIPDQQLWASLHHAQAAAFVEQLPQQLDTVLGERGARLSGGQKQRIAIARALIRDPKLLILDEATSALDIASEQSVQEALDQLMIGRTTVIVAHRLSTIRSADRVIVLDGGAIVDEGTPQRLAAV
jgi:ATP-binding cassette subfamily B protein